MTLRDRRWSWASRAWLAGSLALSACSGQAKDNDAAPGTGTESKPTEAELAADIERIAGTSFETRRDFETCDTYASELRPLIDFLQLHFERSEAGELEVVSSTVRPWLRVERSELVRERAGWSVKLPPPTGGCMARGFEEELELFWSTPIELLFEFEGADALGKPLTLTANVRFEGDSEWTLVEGTRDVTAPFVREAVPYTLLPNEEASYVLEPGPAWTLPRRFEFSEALAPGWSVAVADDAGQELELARDASGAELGFSVARFVPDGFHWRVRGQDLAGQPFEEEKPYAAHVPAQSDGAFESVASTHVESGCVPGESLESGVAVAPPGYPAVPAQAGNRSLYVSGCVAAVRVARAAGATTLRLQARLLGRDAMPISRLSLGTMALDLGSPERLTRDVFDWLPDPVLSTDEAEVSQLHEISLPLPPGSGDVLLDISSPDLVWLDSLVTE